MNFWIISNNQKSGGVNFTVPSLNPKERIYPYEKMDCHDISAYLRVVDGLLWLC